MKNEHPRKPLAIFLFSAILIAGASAGWSAIRSSKTSASSFATAQNEAGSAADRESLRKAEDYWLQQEDDADALEAILGDDFVHVFSSGFVSKGGHIAYVRNLKKPATPAKKHFEDLRVRVYGDTGIANGIVVHENPDGSVRKTIFTDVFVRRSGKWEAVNAQELPYSADAAPK